MCNHDLVRAGIALQTVADRMAEISRDELAIMPNEDYPILEKYQIRARYGPS